ncbi:MAG: 7-carboxy-7-deazaguanine synthase [Bacteroidia bacterium]|nr:7-carboxy-7-deazaguanine synthase [Bacteroidia bacterium]
MSTYAVKEIYHTIQGEGHHTGKAAVFCRFSGCNLWSGREEDRYKAICQFCDTDFWGIDGLHGGKYKSSELAQTINELWPAGKANKFVVFTGGEPLLQLDKPLIDAVHELGFAIAIETNGTIEVPEDIDWVCVSPKANTELIVNAGDELKLVYPQKEAEPERFEHLDFDHFYLQPMDSPDIESNTTAVINYCKTHPKWKVSLQTHKIMGIL